MEDEPSDLEWAMFDRAQHGVCPYGPLTQDEQEKVDLYESHCREAELEHEAAEAAGGRTICPCCGERSVTHRSVVTLGYAGHPEAEYSDLAQCERCDYKDL